MSFDTHQILNLIGQQGGDHQGAAQAFQGQDQVDPNQQGQTLQKFGLDPQQLQSGGYDQQLNAQQKPDFQGYHPGQDPMGQRQQVQF